LKNVFLGDLITVVRGVTYKKEQARKEPLAGFSPLLRATNIQNGLIFDDLVYVPDSVISERQWLQKNDIVIAASSGSASLVGKAAQLRAPWKGTFGAFCFALRPNSTTDPRYVAWYLESPMYRNRVTELAAGVNINNLKAQHIEQTELPLPPLPTQHRIVAEIEEKLSRLDAAQSALLRAQANLKRYRASILEAMVTTASADKQSAHTNCEAVCFFITKGTTPAKEMMQGESTEIAFLKVYNLTSDSTLNHNYKPTFVSRKTHEGDLARSKVVPGDVLMNIVGPPLGQVSIVPESLPVANINQAIARFRPLKTISTKFLAYWLLTPSTVRWTISQAKATVGQLNLTLEICRNIPLALPPLKTQRKIVDEVERRLSVIDRTEQTLRTQLERAKRLRQSILQQAFKPG
jgi:type I restriction enzyme, S subunit